MSIKEDFKKEITDILRDKFPKHFFRVEVQENGEWDVYMSEDFAGREREVADALINFCPEWFMPLDSKKIIRING